MRRIQIGGSGNGFTVIVTQKRPRAKGAAKGMARLGMHDIIIRQNLGLSATAFGRLKVSISKGIWATGKWW